jgi:DnaJ-class molecular chaperone
MKRTSQTCPRCGGYGRCWWDKGFAKHCVNCDGSGYVVPLNEWRPYEPCKEEQ